jgi:hypothetical protein
MDRLSYGKVPHMYVCPRPFFLQILPILLLSQNVGLCTVAFITFSEKCSCFTSEFTSLHTGY